MQAPAQEIRDEDGKPVKNRMKYLETVMLGYSFFATIIALWQCVLPMNVTGSVLLFMCLVSSNILVNSLFAFMARVAPIDADGWGFHMEVQLAYQSKNENEFKKVMYELTGRKSTNK